ncbi:MAG: hypothetical protein GAK37_03054 [Pseudomonas sp.]|nr:MAG: hypothetical protein GAK37_03054 [Pseudomonas sp.]
MLSPTNHSFGYWSHLATKQQEATAPRPKRDVEQEVSIEPGQDRSRHRSGGLDSLGRGRVL